MRRSHRRLGGRRFSPAGFTILEILIAIVVLALGITGIVALFPTAIESGNRTVEDSYAAAITQSVVDAITVGIRESRYQYHSSTAGTWTYFIFSHDGVADAPPIKPHLYTAAQDPPTSGPIYPNGPLAPGTAIWNKDYCILLPRAVNLGSNSPDGRGGGILNPDAENNQSYNEPIFVYPPPLTPDADANPTHARGAGSIDAGGVVDDWNINRWHEATDGTVVPWVPRVYNLGIYRDGTANLPTGFAPGDVRPEFRGEQLSSGDETIAIDPYPTYSFAFTMQRARIDTDGDGQITNADLYSDSLYQVRVMVFKNFDQAAAHRLAFENTTERAGEAIPRTNVPIREFVTLISI